MIIYGLLLFIMVLTLIIIILLCLMKIDQDLINIYKRKCIVLEHQLSDNIKPHRNMRDTVILNTKCV